MPQQGMTDLSRLRKRPLEADAATSARAAGEIDIAGGATIAYSSEDPAHPVEHMLDGQSGPGATRWMSARPDTTEHIVIEFDRPQTISRLVYEVEETRPSAPKKYAWKPRKTAADRAAKFWFRNTTSALGEPPINAKNSASISARSIISVSRLFQTRAAPAPRRLQRSGSSLKRPGAAAQVRKYGPVNGPFRHRGQSTQPAVNFLRVSLEQWIVEEVDLADGERVVPVGSDNPIRPFQSVSMSCPR